MAKGTTGAGRRAARERGSPSSAAARDWIDIHQNRERLIKVYLAILAALQASLDRPKAMKRRGEYALTFVELVPTLLLIGHDDRIASACQQLAKQLTASADDFIRSNTRARLAKRAGGKTRAATRETALKEKRDKAYDTLKKYLRDGKMPRGLWKKAAFKAGVSITTARKILSS